MYFGYNILKIIINIFPQTINNYIDCDREIIGFLNKFGNV